MSLSVRATALCALAVAAELERQRAEWSKVVADPDRGAAFAKERVLRVVEQPLAICRACGVVFPNSKTSHGRHPIARYCPMCRRDNAHERARRAASRDRAYADGGEEVLEGGGVHAVWFRACVSCGESFTSRRPDARSCGKCSPTRRKPRFPVRAPAARSEVRLDGPPALA